MNVWQNTYIKNKYQIDDFMNRNQKIGVIASFFVVGLGQAISGRISRGIIFFVATVVFGLLTDGFTVLAFWIWSMIDAYQINNKELPISTN